MKKYIITVIISLVVGFLLSNYMLKEYENTSLLPIFNQSQTAYLIQQGVYSSYESMQNNTSFLSDYIYSVIDNMYYVYVGITLDSENVSKLQDYYKNNNINTIIKTTTLTNQELISSLKQYDLVLNETNDSSTIKEINKQTLKKYKGEWYGKNKRYTKRR